VPNSSIRDGDLIAEFRGRSHQLAERRA